MKKIIILSLFIVCGCQGIFLSPMQSDDIIYILSPVEDFDNLKTVRRHLLVDIPKTSSGLETKKIALIDDKREMSYFISAKWADDLPDMVHSTILSSFENTRKIKVSEEVTMAANGYKLIIRIRDFQVEYKDGMGRDSNPKTNVKIVYKIVKNNRILKTFISQHTEIAEKNTLSAIVASFDKAFKRVQEDIIRDVFATI